MGKKRILIVEDDYIDRAVLNKILSMEYDVLEATNGLDALRILEKEYDSISLILLDVIMPVMDGFEFLRQMHAVKKYAIIPVIVTTLGDSKGDELKALSNGATDFVMKPYIPQVMLQRINNLVQLREHAAIINQFRFDRLTGLYSREFFFQKVSELLREHPDEKYTMFSVNIENFRLLNDSLGVEACDNLLCQIAATIRLNVTELGICGRYGADRFLYIKRRSDETENRVKRIESMHQYYRDNMNGVSIKWGVYEIDDPSVPVEKMCDRALMAVSSITGLYDSYYAVYDDSLRNKLVREKNIMDIAEQALTNGEFVPYFQPQYSLEDECLIGAEALVRWKHPEWGLVSPIDFIPIFERNGFISRLDRYIWEEVCKELRRWIDEGYENMRVSVNISRMDVYQMNLLSELTGLIEKYHLDPSSLHLEITESAYAENPGQLSKTIGELRNHGFVVEMDDFGSGYSSLNMLSHISLDHLKLDLHFISNETAKPFDVSILNDIVSMAHRLDMRIIAEGVETREQIRRLRAVGCDYVQGYFFAKPMPVNEFDKLLSSQRMAKPGAIERLRMAIGKRYLLVVDENKKYANKLATSLNHRYGLLYADNGKDAIRHIDDKENHVALVVLSMTLPASEINEVLYHVRQVPRNWRIPVIASLKGGEDTEFTMQARECDDFMCKSYPAFDLQRRVNSIMDVVEFHEREKILQDEICCDPFTKMYNHRGLKLAMANISRDEYPLAICLFKLDHLRDINEHHGYQVGDLLIRQFATILERATRHTDIKCRYGGDAFIVVFKRLSSEAVVIAKVEEICEAYRKVKVSAGAADIIPQASAGIVLCPEGTTLSARLIECADKAVGMAQKKENSQYCVWKQGHM